MLDFHNHIIPGVDDGAADLEESRAGLHAMIGNGITHIIATPHISASLTGASLTRYLDKVESGWDALSGLLSREFSHLTVERGFEVMLDTPRPNLSDSLLRLAGTPFVLVEFPQMSIPPNSEYAIRELRAAGWIPVIAHPERYSNMESAMPIIDGWRDAGAYLQLNSGSFAGSYGSRAKRLGWTILAEGNAEYMCSDYHSRGRCTIAAARREIVAQGFEHQLDVLTANGFSLLRGERPASVPLPVDKPRPAWKRIFPWI